MKYGRRPQYFSKIEGDINLFDNGRQPQFFENGRPPHFKTKDLKNERKKNWVRSFFSEYLFKLYIQLPPSWVKIRLHAENQLPS